MSPSIEVQHVVPSATELAHTLTQFFLHLDRSNYAALLALTHAHFRWHRQGKMLDGHDDVHAALNQRAVTQRVAHVITNVAVEDEQPGNTTLGAYMTAYRFDDGRPLEGPATIAGPLRLSRVTTRFEAGDRNNAGWRIAEQVIAPLFQFGTTDAH
ncbi:MULTISPECIES: hypothetical protein [Paraburkholderia]|uniref:nuclear transport factor 2 family protein n=1 Tax=Paraburkholderia TaxID=1822464 RepID=UPI0022509F80|nr:MULTISPECIES: hypothetical protein [Paraburkholderia]MCX4160008.1 hypothetical protein [Paraburkholderia megapolitana]MDN7155508.1 hypothetical protein [Paraburkholderia sp. CHISQ3]MDQ6492552.1 hypothetical protein [Paraburkholderia megapolitana]